MSKSPRVEFRPKRIAEGEWQIEAHCPGEDMRIISGLTSKADIDDWMNGAPQDRVAPIARLCEVSGGVP